MNLSINDFYLSGNKKIIFSYLYLILLFLVVRMFFTFYFGELNILNEKKYETLIAFLYGFRYDSIAISYALVPLFIMNTIVSLFKNKNISQIFWRIGAFYFFFVSLVYFILLGTDMGFYSYFQDHINILIFGFFEDDTSALLKTLYNSYPLVQGLLGLSVVSFLFWKMSFKILLIKTKQLLNSAIVLYMFQVLIMLFLFIGALRGGYSEFVLSPKYADFSNNEFINKIGYNGVLAFERAYQMRLKNTRKDFKLEDSLGYKNSMNKAIEDYTGNHLDLNLPIDQILMRKTVPNSLLAKTQPHVVFLLMESFGASWLEYQTPEFNFLGKLESHLNEDHFSPYMISTGRGTIGSLIGLLTNNPRRPGRRFLSESRYLQLPLKSAAQRPYKEAGYETRLIYGGKLAWRNIGQYAKIQGFDHLDGEAQIRESLQLKGDQGTEWGLFDEHLYRYIEKILQTSTKPQFIFVLTTTNHPPFKMPENYKIPKLTVSESLESKITRERNLFQKRFETFRYTNDKLGEFITNIKESEILSKRTIISFTGDHNFWGFKNYAKRESFLKYTVPFYVRIPDELNSGLSIIQNRPIGHEDIMTTLYNASLSDQSYISFGQNLLDSQVRSNAIGPRVYANESGLFYDDKFYEWDTFPYIKEQSSSASKEESRYYRSLLSVSDFFIRDQAGEK